MARWQYVASTEPVLFTALGPISYFTAMTEQGDSAALQVAVFAGVPGLTRATVSLIEILAAKRANVTIVEI